MKGFAKSRHVSDVRTTFKFKKRATGSNALKEYFRQIYDANHDEIWLYCLRRTANASDAEEILNDTFTIAWQKITEIPAGEQTRPWLFGIARNLLRNSWRKSRRITRLAEQLASESSTRQGPLDAADIALGQSTAARKALFELKKNDQEILRLVCWENLSHREVAAVLGCSENAVAIKLHRAREKFAKKLASQKRVKGFVPAIHEEDNGDVRASAAGIPRASNSAKDAQGPSAAGIPRASKIAKDALDLRGGQHE